jgi:uncharacterized integral membrane protein
VGSLWLKIKVWTKLVLFALLTVYILTFIWKNIDPHVDLWVWYFRPPITLSVLLLALVSFLIGVMGTILSRTTIKTIRQIRQIQERSRAERMGREMEEMKAKAGMLRSRQAPGDAEAVSAGGAAERYDQRANEGELP